MSSMYAYAEVPRMYTCAQGTFVAAMRQNYGIDRKMGDAKRRKRRAATLNNLLGISVLTHEAQDLEAAPRLRTTSAHTCRNALFRASALFRAR